MRTAECGSEWLSKFNIDLLVQMFKVTFVAHFFVEIWSVFCRDVSQIVEKALSHSVEKFFNISWHSRPEASVHRPELTEKYKVPFLSPNPTASTNPGPSPSLRQCC